MKKDGKHVALVVEINQQQLDYFVAQEVTALRTVPTFAIAHRFCASCNGPRKSGFLMVVPAKTDFFTRFITMCEKQILARVIGIRKENNG